MLTETEETSSLPAASTASIALSHFPLRIALAVSLPPRKEVLLFEFYDEYSFSALSKHLSLFSPSLLFLPRDIDLPPLVQLALLSDTSFYSASVSASASIAETVQLHIRDLADGEEITNSPLLCAALSPLLPLSSSTFVRFVPSEGTMFISHAVKKSLELACGAKKKSFSLLSAINHTKTKAGERRLRTLLLQPSTDVAAILERQRLARLFHKKEIMAHHLSKELARLPDLPLFFRALSPPPSETVFHHFATISSMLLSLASLRDILLEHAMDEDAPLFRNLILSINNPLLLRALAILKGISAEAKSPSPIFVIGEGVDSYIDISRRMYRECMKDVSEYKKEVEKHLGLEVRLLHSYAKGFYFASPSPQRFAWQIDIEQKKGLLSFTTLELQNINSRVSAITKEVVYSTLSALSPLLSLLSSNKFLFFTIFDSIAEMDVLYSFFLYSKLHPSSLPSFSSAISADNLYNPLIKHSITNTVALHPTTVNIIRGENMSGKSTLVRSICYHVILSQMGHPSPFLSSSTIVILAITATLPSTSLPSLTLLDE